MMIYAILSDIHDRRRNLEAVLADARARGAQQIISLGDVGGDGCLELLWQSGSKAVFGNYEVSGWRRLAPPYRSWVERWPPLLAEGRFTAVHAAPWWPTGLGTVADFGDWLKRTRRPWRALFPYLTDDPDHIRRAATRLETEGNTILFHGHTHTQSVWCLEPDGHLSKLATAEVTIGESRRYVIGVGSVGLPEDGCWAAYVLYDSERGIVEPVRLQRPRIGGVLGRS